MNKKKDKPGKFSFRKIKKNKNKDIEAPEEEAKRLTESKVNNEELITAPENNVHPKVVNVKTESSTVKQERVNERPVDVGPVLKNVIQNTQSQNGGYPKTLESVEPKGSKRVHSYSRESPEQSTPQMLPMEERRKLKQFASVRSPSSKKDSVSYENEETTSSEKKKKSRSILGSIRGKKSKKAKRSLTDVFEEEAKKTNHENEKVSPDDDDSDEEEEDDWDDDPNNPFSSSFQPKEVHRAQPPAQDVQQKHDTDVQFSLERENSKESDKMEISKDNINKEPKKKKKKMKIPSFRKRKKEDVESEVQPTSVAQSPTSQSTASLPVSHQEQMMKQTTTIPDVAIRQHHVQALEQPRVHSYSYESPDHFIDTENSGHLLSREERNKSKQFSSMRLPKNQQRPVLHFIKEEGRPVNMNEKESVEVVDEELPPNINKKVRQEAKIFSSFRKKMTHKKSVLGKVTEDEAESAEIKDEEVIHSSPYSQSEMSGVRSSAPPNFAYSVSDQQSLMVSEVTKQRSQTLQPTRTLHSPTEENSKPRSATVTIESATLPRNERTLDIEMENEPTKKKKKGSSIMKTLSFRKSSKILESNEQDSSIAISSQQIDEVIVEEQSQYEEPYDLEESSSTLLEEKVQESEADREERKRQLELVFQDMESENEEEDKPKTKMPQKIIKAIKRKGKKKKSDSDEPEMFPLMEQGQPGDNEEVKKKNTSDKILEVKGQLGELKEIAQNNVDKLYEREENLDDLEDRADELSKKASLFNEISVEVKTKMETCNKRTKAIIIGVVIAILVLVVIILIAVVANKSGNTEPEYRTVHIIHVVNGTAPYTPSPG
ncbi:probable serine/threonine-protein kinase kinX [Saccostrea echinata]|uniref:probable serine/threonine-protein kinase kinX n=1 Tax=Saccostrea echinata TaxID=191078 RepID=UPI002A80C302|nr:probable serine/threonine-protein kinase kinX [Saccostrea echinata]